MLNWNEFLPKILKLDNGSSMKLTSKSNCARDMLELNFLFSRSHVKTIYWKKTYKQIYNEIYTKAKFIKNHSEVKCNHIYLTWMTPRFKWYITPLRVHRIFFEVHWTSNIIVNSCTVLQFTRIIHTQVCGW